MPEPKTSRPFQERFLDGFDRSQLRQEVQKVKPRKLGGLRRKYAGWALGASLALGGIGIPLKMGNMLQSADANARHRAPQPIEQPLQPDTSSQITGDLATAKQIADQVAGGITSGVTGAVQDVAKTVTAAPAQVAQAPRAIANVAEQVRQQFFKTEVPFGGIIYDEAKKNDLPPELVAAVVHTESKFVPTARSNRGAVGLMQLVPKTGRWLGANNLNDPAQNIQAGAKYLRYLTDRFSGDQQKAIAAYNAGEGNVRRFNGVPPFKETRNYVQRVRSFQQDLGARVDGAGDATGAAQ
ncbi:MAG TPA: lytic transglycosylase domain-containing protein [Thermoanaerobaculia bacterium]|jgi:soluble lytic murein transglycosylase-like protein|nr:lytic transglycosylase domain-containing protein [Thermoanaerobaculia bacterium]